MAPIINVRIRTRNLIELHQQLFNNSATGTPIASPNAASLPLRA